METLKSIRKSCWTIFKLVFPLYIVVDTLHYFGVLSLISPLFEPITKLIGLPSETALALTGGGLFNLYTGIALASPLNLSQQQWTTVAVFLGLFHSIIIEAAVLKKLSIPIWVTVSMRLAAALLCSYFVSMGSTEGFSGTPHITHQASNLMSFGKMLTDSILNASLVVFKIMVLIALIIAAIDQLKKSKFFGKQATKHSWLFSLVIGLLLGVTYGAGLLLGEKNKPHASELPLSFFLLLCHGIIEETLLFTMFGAKALPIVLSRVLSALLVSGACYYIVRQKTLLSATERTVS